MSGKLFLTSALVARELGISPAAFLRKRVELEAEHGFPLPMPQAQRPKIWRADQVTAWLDAQGRPAVPAAAPLGDNVVLLREAAQP